MTETKHEMRLKLQQLYSFDIFDKQVLSNFHLETEDTFLFALFGIPSFWKHSAVVALSSNLPMIARYNPKTHQFHFLGY